MTGLTSPRYALPDIQNECYLLTNCPYEVDTFRNPLVATVLLRSNTAVFKFERNSFSSTYAQIHDRVGR